MALWSIMASPLIMSVDLRKLHPFSRSVLLSHRAIAINQDRLGIQGRRIAQVCSVCTHICSSVISAGLYPMSACSCQFLFV